MVTAPPQYERPWLILVVGIVILFYGFLGYLSGGISLSALIGGMGTILLGVAQYLPPRWRAGAIALRVVFLLSLVIMTVLFFTERVL